jgi:hypothetical protein
VTPGRKVAGHARHKARDAAEQQLGHTESRVDPEHFVGMQGRSGLHDGTAMQLRFTASLRGHPHEQMPQGQAHLTN